MMLDNVDVLPFILGGVALLIVIIILLTVLILNKKKNKKSKNVIDDEYIKNIYTMLGGKTNVLKISIDNARLKFEVKDLVVVDLQGLKDLSQNGVFVTNNIVKTLFKYDSKEIMKQMERGNYND